MAVIREKAGVHMTTFSDAQREYVSALAALESDAAQRCADAQQRYAEAQHQAGIDYQQSYEEAFRKYQDATADPEGGAASATAYLAFAAEVSKAQMAAARTLAESQHEAEQALRDAWFESQDEQRNAYGKYVRAVQSAWTGAETLDPSGLVFAAQSIAATAAFAASTLGADVGRKAATRRKS
jgi:hypothetical protein